MKRQHYFLSIGFAVMVTAGLAGVAAAAIPIGDDGGPATTTTPAPDGNPTIDNCVAIGLPVAPAAKGTCTGTDAQGNTYTGVSNDPATGGAIINYLRGWLFLLNLAVPGVILLMIIISGVQYITAGANSAAVKGAKDRLVNSMIALVLYLMMFAILQFLVPGGVL